MGTFLPWTFHLLSTCVSVFLRDVQGGVDEGGIAVGDAVLVAILIRNLYPPWQHMR